MKHFNNNGKASENVGFSSRFQFCGSREYFIFYLVLGSLSFGRFSGIKSEFNNCWIHHHHQQICNKDNRDRQLILLSPMFLFIALISNGPQTSSYRFRFTDTDAHILYSNAVECKLNTYMLDVRFPMPDHLQHSLMFCS